jgi:hypothetical protein
VSARRALLVGGLGALLVLGAGAAWWFTRDTALRATVTEVVVQRRGPAGVQEAAPMARAVDAYAGQGAWVDVFDYSPPYAGANPPEKPAVVDAMNATGIGTVFVQAARNDPKSPGLLEDRWLLAEFLLTSLEKRLVKWRPPQFGDGGH